LEAPRDSLESPGGFLRELGRQSMSSKLYVGNLPFGVSEEDLKKLFSEAGEVQSVKIIIDQYSGRSRGFGFVEMTSKAEADKAISLLNGKILTDRTLIVNEARPQKQRGGEFRGRGKNDR